MKTGSPPPSGFRFSREDAWVLTFGVVLTIIWWKIQPALAPALPIVLGHFFLFCNVFRIPRRSELIWAGVFLLNALFWALKSDVLRIDWLTLLAVQAPVTIGLILYEMRQPGYHGVGASFFNNQKS